MSMATEVSVQGVGCMEGRVLWGSGVIYGSGNSGGVWGSLWHVHIGKEERARSSDSGPVIAGGKTMRIGRRW